MSFSSLSLSLLLSTYYPPLSLSPFGSRNSPLPLEGKPLSRILFSRIMVNFLSCLFLSFSPPLVLLFLSSSSTSSSPRIQYIPALRMSLSYEDLARREKRVEKEGEEGEWAGQKRGMRPVFSYNGTFLSFFLLFFSPLLFLFSPLFLYSIVGGQTVESVPGF
jgi:hypothetical protein